MNTSFFSFNVARVGKGIDSAVLAADGQYARVGGLTRLSVRLHDLNDLSGANIHIDPATASGEKHPRVSEHPHDDLVAHSHRQLPPAGS